ncbi:hypothetical protein AB205_0102040, partial [Aquarana catesbeiana]
MNQQCLTVQFLIPANISKEEKRNIFLTIPDLPPLYQDESYSCFFEDFESRAVRTQSGVMCPSPDPSKAPVIKPGTDHVRVQLLLRFGDVVISTAEFTFYDCMAVAQLYKSAPCRGCVSSEWGCNWCIHQHVCTHKGTCEEGTIIRNKLEKNPAPDVFTPVIVPEPEPTPEVIPTTPTPATTVKIRTPSPTPEASTTTTTESTTLPVIVTTTTPIPTTVPTTIVITTIVTTPEPTTPEPTTLKPTTEELTPELTTQPPTEEPTSVPTTIPTTLPVDIFTSPIVTDDEVLPATPDSASTILSGDGDVDGVSPQFPSIIEPDMDYQADSLGFAELMINTQNNGGPYVGPEACPCVHSIHSPSLLPVNVERKITLIGKNFHHYQVFM